MKKLYGIMALAGTLALASCSADEPAVSGGSSNEAKAFINVQLSMPQIGSRADNLNSTGSYDYGTEAENTINSLILGFYGENGSVVELVTVPVTAGNHTTTSNNVAVTEPVQVGVEDNTATNAKTLIAFVNIAYSDVAGKTLDQIQSATFDAYNPYNGFAMTNSGYYATSGYVNTNALSTTDFYKVGETSQNTVQIYVERVAAKVQLDQITTVSTYKVYNADGDEVTLTFTPTAWDVQATAQQSYYLKQNDATTPTGDNAWINSQASDFRSHWAKSYGYSIESPKFLPTGEASVDQDLTASALLKYITYDQIANGTFATADAAPYTSTSTVYVLENTFPTTRLTAATDYNPWSAVTSIVLAGKYTASEEFTNDAEDGSFYLRSKTQMNSEGNALETVYQILTEDEVINAMLQAASYITKGEDHEALTEDDVELAYIAGDNNMNPANYRFLQIDEDSEETFFVNGVETEASQVNTELAKIAPARLYSEGKAFFYIPLKHYVAGETSTTAQYLPLDDTLKEGNYGIVRNNCYVLTVNKITGLGTGAGDDTDIPVPDPEDDSYAIDAVLNVLQWHMRSQSVDL